MIDIRRDRHGYTASAFGTVCRGSDVLETLHRVVAAGHGDHPVKCPGRTTPGLNRMCVGT